MCRFLAEDKKTRRQSSPQWAVGWGCGDNGNVPVAINKYSSTNEISLHVRSSKRIIFCCEKCSRSIWRCFSTDAKQLEPSALTRLEMPETRTALMPQWLPPLCSRFNGYELFRLSICTFCRFARNAPVRSVDHLFIYKNNLRPFSDWDLLMCILSDSGAWKPVSKASSSCTSELTCELQVSDWYRRWNVFGW